MSAKQMGMVWEIDLPANQQAILLALADHADHEGMHARPSVALLSWKTGQSEPTVRRMLKALRLAGLIEPTKHGKGGRGLATEYRLRMDRGKKKPPLRVPTNPINTTGFEPEKGISLTGFEDENPITQSTETLSNETLNPITAMIEEPLEPSKNHIAASPNGLASESSPKPERKARPRDLHFETVCRLFEYDWNLLNDTERKRLNTAVGLIKQARGSPDDIERAFHVYPEAMPPNTKRTAMAIASNWQDLMKAARNHKTEREKLHAMYPPLN